MKRLVFKKWVEVVLFIMGFTGLFIVCAFEWESLIPYIVGLVMLAIPTTLEIFYGRN